MDMNTPLESSDIEQNSIATKRMKALLHSETKRLKEANDVHDKAIYQIIKRELFLSTKKAATVIMLAATIISPFIAHSILPQVVTTFPNAILLNAALASVAILCISSLRKTAKEQVAHSNYSKMEDNLDHMSEPSKVFGKNSTEALKEAWEMKIFAERADQFESQDMPLIMYIGGINVVNSAVARTEQLTQSIANFILSLEFKEDFCFQDSEPNPNIDLIRYKVAMIKAADSFFEVVLPTEELTKAIKKEAPTPPLPSNNKAKGKRM